MGDGRFVSDTDTRLGANLKKYDGGCRVRQPSFKL